MPTSAATGGCQCSVFHPHSTHKKAIASLEAWLSSLMQETSMEILNISFAEERKYTFIFVELGFPR